MPKNSNRKPSKTFFYLALLILQYELTEESMKLEQLIINQRKLDNQINESEEMMQFMKKIKAYEYKLDKLNQKHNQALAEIKR
jgi:hypothetical protein